MRPDPLTWLFMRIAWSRALFLFNAIKRNVLLCSPLLDQGWTKRPSDESQRSGSAAVSGRDDHLAYSDGRTSNDRPRSVPEAAILRSALDRCFPPNRSQAQRVRPPILGLYTQIDGRADPLWAICMTIEDAQTLANRICSEQGMATVHLETDNPSTEILDEIRVDPESLESIIDASEDGEYQEPIGHSLAVVTFDGVLTDRGEQVPLQLVLHELAHHVEWHEIGKCSGHYAQPFIEALPM